MAKQLKMEKDEIIRNFRNKYIANQKEEGALATVANMFMGNMTKKVSV